MERDDLYDDLLFIMALKTSNEMVIKPLPNYRILKDRKQRLRILNELIAKTLEWGSPIFLLTNL